MYHRIVVAYNAGNEGRDALAIADRLARLERARIVVVQAMPRAGGRDAQREMETRVAAARASMAALLAPGLPAEYHPLVGRPFAPSVHAIADADDADLIVTGQSRLGPIARAHLGGGGELLVDGAPCPIAVAAPDQAQRAPFRAACLGVGFDGSPGAALAAIAAADLAHALGARLRLIAVGGAERAALVAADGLAERVPAHVVALSGDPVRALLGQPGAGVDALVVGHRERRPQGRLGVSVRVMGNAGCPVWVVPASAAAVVLGARTVAAAATAAA
jgi:nucleotide-binding universal stress UspA family protein